MATHDLFEKSPIRLFEKIADDGLHSGEIGVIASRKGLGKTSVLVQFGVDALLKGDGIIHVSFDQKSENVISWYASVVGEVAKKKNITISAKMLTELMKKRIILNCGQDTDALSRVVSTVSALSGSGIGTAVVLIDDLDFGKVSLSELRKLADFAAESGIAVWISTTTDATVLPKILNVGFDPLIACAVLLEQKADGTTLKLLKLRDKTVPSTALKLDTKTLLIVGQK